VAQRRRHGKPEGAGLHTPSPGVDGVVDTGTDLDMILYIDVLRRRDGQIVLSGSYYTMDAV